MRVGLGELWGVVIRVSINCICSDGASGAHIWESWKHHDESCHDGDEGTLDLNRKMIYVYNRCHYYTQSFMCRAIANIQQARVSIEGASKKYIATYGTTPTLMAPT